MSAFVERVQALKTSRYERVDAWRNGYVHVDLDQLRAVIVDAQRSGNVPYSDPVGVILRYDRNRRVRHGQTIVEVRCAGEPAITDAVNSAVEVLGHPPQRPFPPEFISL